MDELSNLKQAWEALSGVNAQKQYSSDELSKIVRQRSKSELVIIKRKIIIETGLGILLSIILVIWVSFINPTDTVYALLFIFTILVVSFVPYIKVLKSGLVHKLNIKQHISEFLFSFDKLVVQYIRLSTILVPVAGLGGFILGLRTTLNAEQWHSIVTIVNVLLVVAVLAAISFAAQLFLRRYFNWIYGKNINRLKECLAELEDREEQDYV